jgi:hypothetical protein
LGEGAGNNAERKLKQVFVVVLIFVLKVTTRNVKIGHDPSLPHILQDIVDKIVPTLASGNMKPIVQIRL